MGNQYPANPGAASMGTERVKHCGEMAAFMTILPKPPQALFFLSFFWKHGVLGHCCLCIPFPLLPGEPGLMTQKLLKTSRSALPQSGVWLKNHKISTKQKSIPLPCPRVFLMWRSCFTPQLWGVHDFIWFVFLMENRGSHLVSQRAWAQYQAMCLSHEKMGVLPTFKCRKHQEGQMQTPNSAPLASIWILMAKAPLQWVKIRGGRLSPDPVTTCQQEKWVNFHWLFFRAGYCTLTNNQKATSWKITGPLTALVLNLPCTFSYILPLIADIVSAWPPPWHRFYSDTAVSSLLCSSLCFPELFHQACLTCQNNPSLSPQPQPGRKGCTLENLHLHGSNPISIGFRAAFRGAEPTLLVEGAVCGGSVEGVIQIRDLCVLHALIASRNLSLWQCVISRHFTCSARAVSEDEWPIQMGSASHPDRLTYNADRLEQEMKDRGRGGELFVPTKPHGFKNKMHSVFICMRWHSHSSSFLLASPSRSPPSLLVSKQSAKHIFALGVCRVVLQSQPW